MTGSSVQPGRAAVSQPNRPPGPGSEPAGKRKVMVYVPAGVHRAMRQHALADGERSTSDVYVEAARAFLASRGVAIEEGGADGVPAIEPAPSIAGLVVAIEGLRRRVEEALERGAAPRPTEGQPAGTRSAEAMRAVLKALKEAGTAGLSHRELSDAVRGLGIKSGAEETAKAVLRAVGLVRCEGRRWYLDGSGLSD